MDGQRLLNEAMEFGQFPEVLCQPKASIKRDILQNYRNTYFIRDLMQLANIENLDALLTLFHHLARSIGSALDISHFAREAGISFPTAKKHLGFIPCDRFYYYRSVGGNEVDLVFEIGDTVYAVEIKSALNPVSGDVRNLRDFARQCKRPCQAILFYRGTEYRQLDGVQLILVAALLRSGGL